jgi:hypothetical protein
MERGLQDGQRPRREQGTADALQNPRGDQHTHARRQPAQQRGRREPDDTGDEDLATAEAVTQRTAEQDQRGEAQGVAVDRPLQGRSVRAEAYGDARQRDIDDRGVDEWQGRNRER